MVVCVCVFVILYINILQMDNINIGYLRYTLYDGKNALV